MVLQSLVTFLGLSNFFVTDAAAKTCQFLSMESFIRLFKYFQVRQEAGTCCSKCKLLALPTNIRVALENVPQTNSLAYFALMSLTIKYLHLVPPL